MTNGRRSDDALPRMDVRADGADGPLWRRIEEVLSEEIGEGRWKPGERLPSEHALARRFGVNRHTLRRSIASMRDAGLVHVRRGAGATVTHATTDYPIGRRTRFSENLLAAGRRPGREVLRGETVGASPQEAEALGLAPGEPVHLAETLSRMDGVPVTASRMVWPAARLPGFLEALRGMESVTKALAACGVQDYDRIWTRMTAQRPGALLARQLQIAETQPVLRTEALSRAPDGGLIEYGLTWICTERMPVFVGEDPGPRPD